MSSHLEIIQNSFEYGGEVHHIEYRDVDSFDDLDPEEVRQIYGICFVGDQVALVQYHEDKPNLPGGKIDPNEHWETALHREIEEELNMRILKWAPIGYQYPLKTDKKRIYELRVVVIVEPIDEFQADPAGTVISSKLVAPEEVNSYIDYGPVGERMLARALELKSKLKA